MTTLFNLIILTTVIVLGIKIATSPGMIFEKIGYYCGKKISEGNRLYEPACACEWCMPSVYSVFGFLFAAGIGVIPFRFEWVLLFYYPIVVFGSSYTSGMLWLVYKTIDAIRDKAKIEHQYYINAEKLIFYDLKDRKRIFQDSKSNSNEKNPSKEK